MPPGKKKKSKKKASKVSCAKDDLSKTTVTAEELSKWLIKASGEPVSPRRVRQLAEDNIIPKPARGKYLLMESVVAYYGYIGKKSTREDVDKASILLKEAQTKKLDFELDIAKGEYVSVGDIGKFLERVFNSFRSKTLALPTKLASLVYACGTLAETKAVVEDAVNALLRDLAAFDPAHWFNGGKTSSSGTASKAENKRVGRRKQNTKP